MNRTTVSLCMIVRDEENNLRPCLNGIAGVVDEIIVVDTGSTDQTRRIAAEFGARIFDFPWIDDFSAARNETLRYATGKWILWLDADDRIDAANRRRLQELFSRLDSAEFADATSFGMICLSECVLSQATLTYNQERLFKVGARLKWTGRVHEHLVPIDAGKTRPAMIPTNIVIQHEGYRDRDKLDKKQQRDMRILQLACTENPFDPTILLYLARLRYGQKQRGEALNLVQRSIQLDPHHRAATTPQAYVLAINCMRESNCLGEALRMADAGLIPFPQDANLLFLRGALLYDANRLQEAQICFQQLVSNASTQQSITGSVVGVEREKSRMMLGYIFHRQGKLHEAAAEFRRAAEANPLLADAWSCFGETSLALGLRDQVDEALHRLNSCPNSEAISHNLRAMAYLADGNFALATQSIDASIALRPDVPGAYAILSEILFRQGTDIDHCIHAHRDALARNPGHPDVNNRLKKLLETKTRRIAASSIDADFFAYSTTGEISGLANNVEQISIANLPRNGSTIQ